MTPPPTDDRALLEAHVHGDPAAFGDLFARHRDRLWAVALRTTGDTDDAAEALQDAMISAFRRAESFRGDSAVTTWLHRIVVNACLDRLRRAKVRRAEPLPDDLDEHASRGDLLVATDGVDPQQAAETSMVRSQVLRALDQIAPEQKAALVLVDLQGYPVQEAAAILECAPGTVKSRCARGRSRLAVLLGHLREPGPAAPHQPGPRARDPHAPSSGTDPPSGTSHQNPHSAPDSAPGEGR